MPIAFVGVPETNTVLDAGLNVHVIPGTAFENANVFVAAFDSPRDTGTMYPLRFPIPPVTTPMLIDAYVVFAITLRTALLVIDVGIDGP